MNNNHPNRMQTLAGKFVAVILLPALLAPLADAATNEDLFELPVEQLFNLEISTASKYLQRQADIPVATTVIGADQIRGFGYRTLGDILRSVPGLYVSTDGIYDTSGVRGLSGSNQFNGRVLIMIDGYRVNEAIYDSGTIGTEFPLDVDLIKRVEVVRGPASSIYGSNAFFGVVNVITKQGRDYQGGELAGVYGGFDSYKGRFSYGRKHSNGLEYLISGSGFYTRGPDLYYPEYATPDANNGLSTLALEDSKQVFLKANYGNFSLLSGWGRRDRNTGYGNFGSNFNDASAHFVDTHAFVQAQYQTDLTSKLNFNARAWHGDYDFRGLYPYGEIDNIDTATAFWSGFELRLLSTHFDHHHLTGGVEVQKNWLQQQDNYDLQPYASYLSDRRHSTRTGVYFQDDFAVTDRLNLSLGVRFDDYSLVPQAMFSPKGGISWRPFDDTAFKLLYGESFRAPNVWHQFYAYAPYYDIDDTGNSVLSSKGLRPNGKLKPEHARTVQATWEQNYPDDWLTRATFYYIWLDDLFVLSTLDATFDQNINGAPQSAWGGEFELERRWRNGALLRASYSLQYAQTRDGAHVFDSPQHLFKLNMLTPLWHPDWHGGLEILGMGPRDDVTGRVPGYALANATLNWQPHPSIDVSASVYDLFDNQYADLRIDGVHVPSDGRNFRLKLQLRF